MYGFEYILSNPDTSLDKFVGLVLSDAGLSAHRAMKKRTIQVIRSLPTFFYVN